MTHSASRQTYWTIRLLADRALVEHAYRAYAYFRWVDDSLDQPALTLPERRDFLARQQEFLASCIQAAPLAAACPQEKLLADLVVGFPGNREGLFSYLNSMMAVMAFDAERRGRLISQKELDTYTHDLALAVTDAMHTFIGRTSPPPPDQTRLTAVSAAHITHMLRDTLEDQKSGYFNIPREYLDAHGLTPFDVNHPAYREWVRTRVDQARRLFAAGRGYMQRVPCLRCRLAGHAYMARFEGILDTIQMEGYLLRHTYENGASAGGDWQRSWSVLTSLFASQPLPHSGGGFPLEEGQ